MIDGSVEPGMVSTRAKSDQVMLVSDVFLLRVVQGVVVRDVILDATILLFRWTIDCQQLLRRPEDSSLFPQSAYTFLLSSPSRALP